VRPDPFQKPTKDHKKRSPVVVAPWYPNTRRPDPGRPIYFQLRDSGPRIHFVDTREFLHAGLWWAVVRWAYADDIAPEVIYE